MRTLAPVSLRNGMTVQQNRSKLAKQRVNAMFSHARWAGRHITRFVLLENDFNVKNARERLSETKWAETLLQAPYQVHELLVPYSLKVAREKLAQARR